ncbi:MAG TPA: hypothetical protein VGH14_14430 [Solirubrobacterales bacterium]|jgi:hypothetical protein
MLARVAHWEGAEANALEATAEEIRQRAAAEGGPPPGVPAKGLMLLEDPAGGRAITITLFENEEDYREGDATLDSMSPPSDGMGRRVGVDKYEVAVQLEA